MYAVFLLHQQPVLMDIVKPHTICFYTQVKGLKHGLSYLLFHGRYLIPNARIPRAFQSQDHEVLWIYQVLAYVFQKQIFVGNAVLPMVNQLLLYLIHLCEDSYIKFQHKQTLMFSISNSSIKGPMIIQNFAFNPIYKRFYSTNSHGIKGAHTLSFIGCLSRIS